MSNARAPEWRVAGEQEHLILERQFYDPGNAWAVLTGCNKIITPSQRDIRLNAEEHSEKVPRCRVCAIREPELVDAPHSARTS